MEPLFTNHAIAFGLLVVVLAFVMYTSASQNKRWQRFYTFVPPLLLCYFLPALLNWPLGLIAYDWFEPGLYELLVERGVQISQEALSGMTYGEVKELLNINGIEEEAYKQYQGHSPLYFVASRYLLPAGLILLCISIDIKGLIGLGSKSLIMFFSSTVGIMVGGPIALLVAGSLAPSLLSNGGGELWRGLSTIAGSWIGGGGNQAAMKEIYEVDSILFQSMVLVDVIVANIWMGVLLYGAGISRKIDKWLQADASSVDYLKEKVEAYAASIARMPTLKDTFSILAIAFGGTAFAHIGADILAPIFDGWNASTISADYPSGKLVSWGLSTLMSGFFWLIVIATTLGFAFSFTKVKTLEGVGASRFASVFIYLLVATIGIQMNIKEIFNHLDLFAIGIIWMLVHVSVLLFMARLIKAPFFFVAVGSQANVGGAASAPIVASAFSPSLAPVGAIMAVLGYALGTYGAVVCAELMRVVSGF